MHRRGAAPAFTISFVASVIRLARDPRSDFTETHFIHAKLFSARVIIGAHHVVGAQAKKRDAGAATDPGPVGPVAWALLGGALVTAYFALVKPL